MTELKYGWLNNEQRIQAKAMFANAGKTDGYWYTLGSTGKVLSRNRVSPS